MATGLGREDSLVEPWSHESEDMKFAARLLEADDPLAIDENMVQGADAGDVADTTQQEAATEVLRNAVLKSGGDEQSAEPADEEEGKDLSKGGEEQT